MIARAQHVDIIGKTGISLQIKEIINLKHPEAKPEAEVQYQKRCDYWLGFVKVK